MADGRKNMESTVKGGGRRSKAFIVEWQQEEEAKTCVRYAKEAVQATTNNGKGGGWDNIAK